MSVAARMRRVLRHAGFGALTVFGIAQRGFFIPYRYAGGIGEADKRRRFRAAEARLAEAEPRFREVLDWMAGLAADLQRIGGEKTGARWNQDWFPRLDAAAAYTFTRQLRPARIVEVGSGHSTRFYARAVADGALDTRITAIDPAPRAELAASGIDHACTALQGADRGLFDGLAAGDILSIDSSHILMPGSDVDLLLSDILPILAPGVAIQLHDIFLPDGYPAEWDWRGYNEQLGVLQLVLGGRWELLFASHYVATRMQAALADHVAAALPLVAGARESSLWMRRLPG